MSTDKNHLAAETSPYLLQHANNPVDWYPWGEAALKKAKAEDKPILLSIGYSACHWCHVMAHESFENEQTAAVMNELFVNIKVDREERPDIDKIYQTAQHLLTQRTGGWPLTMFLTPEDQVPFFGGTYFPDSARHGLPAFIDLLQHIAQAYQEKRHEIIKQNDSLQDVLSNIYNSTQTTISLDAQVLHNAKEQLQQSFDHQHGGFGRAPKFPHPTNIERLLRHWVMSKQNDEEDFRALHPATFTLRKMAGGGIFDHVSGGFCRYSVDDYWMIPHFEKMLYDNGPLLTLYSQAYQALHEPGFKDTAIAIADWTIREMQAPEGGYYSSLDADSEGIEGKYYVWDLDELQSLLTTEEFAIIEHRFGLGKGPNFEDKYHLHEFETFAETADHLKLKESQCQLLWQQAREKLFSARQKRIRPGRDEKVLTSWNALMIKGMLTACRVFNREDYLDSAQRALTFIRTTMHQDRRLLASYKDGKAHLNAYLDDYAFLLDAILESLQTQWSSEHLDFAVEIAQVMLDQFQDKENGGFYFTGEDHEALIQRPKLSADEATPAGNGVAAYSLLRFGYLLTDTKLIEAAERTVESASYQISNTPMAHGSLLHVLEEILQPPKTIILRGEQAEIAHWQRLCQKDFLPSTMVYAIPKDENNLPESINSKFSVENKILAYICEGMSCQNPIDSEEELLRNL